MSNFKVFPDSPAFPEIHVSHWRSMEKKDDGTPYEGDHVLPRWNGGLTKREYFASDLMAGMIAGSQGLNITVKQFAEQAVKLADALIEELNK